MEPRKSFLLRMDPALWAELESWARQELRSVNGQIEYVLKQAVLRRKGAAAQERERKMERSKEAQKQTGMNTDERR
jgi:hypothetical protein